ncbi:hypothetical protein DW115_00765 [Clostridium sp. AM09-51]|nr:hypothetical protein DW115_00765 [Clostridium sp. AM09-51]
MKTRKILALSMAVATMATASTAAFAAELTPSSTTGNTEVTANIKASGEISYVITIPDKVDFGTLTPPETDTDSFKDVPYEVTAVNIEGLSEDQYVLIRLKDKDATEEDSQFYLTQKTSPNTKFIYDVYDISPIENYYIPLASVSMTEPNGYFLVAFNEIGAKTTGTLRFNQKQLYGKDISEIAGDYSGTMVFTSSILTF